MTLSNLGYQIKATFFFLQTSAINHFYKTHKNMLNITPLAGRSSRHGYSGRLLDSLFFRCRRSNSHGKYLTWWYRCDD